MEPLLTRGEYESDQKSVWKELGRLAGIIEGPPHPSPVQKMNDFIVEFRTLETERAKQHKANTTRLNIIITALAAIAGWLAIFHH